MNPQIDSTPNPDETPAKNVHPEPIIRGHLIGCGF